MSMTEYLRGEGAVLSDDRSSIEWDHGDRLRWLGNALIGRGSEFSREGVRARAKQQLEKDFNKTYAGKIKEAQDYLSGTTISTAGGLLGGNKTEAETKANIDSLLRTGEYVQEYAKIPGARLTDIGPGSSLSTIQNLATQQLESNKQAEEEKIERKEADRRAERYAERVADREESIRQFDNNLALRKEQLDANIAASQGNLDMSRLKLQMDQSRYMYDAETRRREKTANLVKALAALGGAFAL